MSFERPTCFDDSRGVSEMFQESSVKWNETRENVEIGEEYVPVRVAWLRQVLNERDRYARILKGGVQ